MSPSSVPRIAEQINQHLVRFTVLWVKAWDGVAEIRVLELRIFVDLATFPFKKILADALPRRKAAPGGGPCDGHIAN